ncbi:MAG: ATP-binding cassette domain-containing protein [Methanobrevibacter sp.]|uniref:energy-coupling factor ABC transporter ATP-binding protein n=1 Tax=Methanobrevibacter sp. TaxID=66852 RepID=UPI0026DF77EF|nr:ATP-binding cassette domain-containing protein [Methanobrevibacter sp.]MDO5848024.1 ATP-binding cassette domain-containing protein [Methanobrevibacter sp.]
MEEIVLKTNNLNYIYQDGAHALKNVNIEIRRGEKVAIMGPNGAGKSTLFLHFNGLNEPSSGNIEINGKPIKYDKKELLEVRQKVGIVFQNPNDQLFAPSVKEDVAFGPMNLGLSHEEVEKRTHEALELVEMTESENKPPHHLSGGQQKRIAIAGIIAMMPEIMVLDEPTAGLDPHGVDQILKILNKLNEDGMTIVISSHDVEMINDFADRIFVLKDGEIIGDGTPDEIFSNHELLETASLKPPKTAEILKILKNNGLDVNINKIKVDECCNEILQAKKS